MQANISVGQPQPMYQPQPVYMQQPAPQPSVIVIGGGGGGEKSGGCPVCKNNMMPKKFWGCWTCLVCLFCPIGLCCDCAWS